MKNKLTLAILALVIIILPIVMGAVPKSGDTAFLQVTLVSQTPDPVEPGSDTEVRLKIENIGGDNAEDVEIELVSTFPFSVATSDNIKFLGSIHGRQTGDVGKIEKFNIIVHKNAIDGENDIIFRYRTRAYPIWTELDPFTINVRTKEAILSVSSVITIPETLKQGEPGILQIKLENLAASRIRNVRTSLDLSNVPFATVGSGNEKIVGIIEPGQTKTIVFNIMPEGEAKSKVYKIPYKLKYSDWSGNEFVKNGTTGIVVGDKPDLSIILEASEIITAGSAGIIGIRFVNKGTEDIKFLNVILDQTNDFELLSAKEQYLENETLRTDEMVYQAEDEKNS